LFYRSTRIKIISRGLAKNSIRAEHSKLGIDGQGYQRVTFSNHAIIPGLAGTSRERGKFSLSHLPDHLRLVQSFLAGPQPRKEDSRLVSRHDRPTRREIIGNRFPEESADHEETHRRLLRDCFRLLFEWQTRSARNNGNGTRWGGFVGGG